MPDASMNVYELCDYVDYLLRLDAYVEQILSGHFTEIVTTNNTGGPHSNL